MKTIYLAARNEFATLGIDLTPEGAEVAGYGEAEDAFFALDLTDTERLLLAASLLRDGESVRGGDVSEVSDTSKHREVK
jgi:hypothetical protein